MDDEDGVYFSFSDSFATSANRVYTEAGNYIVSYLENCPVALYKNNRVYMIPDAYNSGVIDDDTLEGLTYCGHMDIVPKSDDSALVIEIKNKFLFDDLSEYELYWCQCSDKGVLREGTVDVKIKPGTKAVVDLELNRITNTECYLNLALRTKEDNSWSKAGHIVAEEQFVINEFENTYDELEPGEERVVADTYGSLRIFTEDINIRFERRERNQLYSV